MYDDANSAHGRIYVRRDHICLAEWGATGAVRSTAAVRHFRNRLFLSLVDGAAAVRNGRSISSGARLYRLVGLSWIAIRANRGWPLWACAAQLIVMLGHLAKLFEVRDTFRGYWAMTQVPFLMQLAVLLVGTAAHVARQRIVGRYPSWRAG